MFKTIGKLFGFIWDFTIALMGGSAEPLASHYVDTTPETFTSADSITTTQEKKNLTPNGESIVGLKDPSLTINATGSLTTTTFDTTTYGDRAIVKLTNATGSSINLTGLCIKGKPVMQLSGQNGYVWEYSDYDAIEKEGEQFVEVSNDFIFDPVQAKQIGDFVWKELKPHKLYSLMLIGCQYQYEIGDVYHLTLEHTMNGGTMENIDTDVEVMGVSINRSVGGVGMTNLNLRVPSEAWALTLAKNSKLVGAGNAQRLNNRSNVVTVAASTWTGQADYFCDGTDDNVEIQAAIDYLDSIGGGSIILTSGQFNIVQAGTISYGGDETAGYGCLVKSNISIAGEGYATILSFSFTNTYSFCLVCDESTSNISFANFACTIVSETATVRFIWSGMCSSTGLINIYSTGNMIMHGNNKTAYVDSAGPCNITYCHAGYAVGSNIHMSSSYITQIFFTSYSTATSCRIGVAVGGTAATVNGTKNSITGCYLRGTVAAVLADSSSYSVISSCTLSGGIQNTGTGNVVANNA